MILSTDKYKDVHAIMGEKANVMVSEVVQSFEEKPKADMLARYAASGKGGMVYILTNGQKAPGKIVEHVMGLDQTTISCLYEPHPIFSSPGDLLRAREDLIEQLERANNAAPGKLQMMDEGRGRPVFLQEMCFAQLKDLVDRELMRRT